MQWACTGYVLIRDDVSMVNIYNVHVGWGLPTHISGSVYR